jgi:predicted transposase YdaD
VDREGPEGNARGRCKGRDFPDSDQFRGCDVKAHHDVPLHVARHLRTLGMQYRLVLTRGNLGSELVSEAQLLLENEKEAAWMAVHADQRDVLEDTMYRCLEVDREGPEGNARGRCKGRDFPDSDQFRGCDVKAHHDVPLHVARHLRTLGMQYRLVLTRGNLGSELVSEAQLLLENEKEAAWMAVHADQRDVLEDTMYRCLFALGWTHRG